MSGDIPIDPSAGGIWIVEAGDTVDSIADRVGHFWETIWNDGQNSTLRSDRAHRNILLPGDKVYVPALRAKNESRATDQIHTFKRNGVPVRLIYQVKNFNGDGFAGKKYILRVGFRRYEGETDNEGMIDRYISPSDKTGRLYVTLDEPGFPATLEVPLKIGTLAPPDTVLGAQQRLNLLGYRPGVETGSTIATIKDALVEFQRDNDLERSGALDEATADALRLAYGL